MSLNHIVLQGRLTHSPELRRTGSSVAVTSFTLAVERDFKADNGERETDFIDCVAWRSTAEFVGKYFAKGQMAVVSGRLQIRPYTAKDGSNRRAAEVVAENVYFGEAKRDKQQTASQFAPPTCPPQYPPAPQYPQQTPGQFDIVEEDDSELPF